MNRHHLAALLWLRWRLRVNQIKRSGVLNTIALAMLVPSVTVLAALMFAGFFLLGLLALPEAPPPVPLLVWDGLILVFLFAWVIGLLSELQRSEVLSLDRLLHLPLSLSGAFAINYLSSLFSVNLAIFLPAMVGLLLGQMLSQGPALLAAVPLLVAFVVAVTALTYQFQGWLASMMANPRRRKLVVGLLTLGLALVSQIPVLVNVWRPWSVFQGPGPVEIAAKQAELDRAFRAGEMTAEEYRRRMTGLYRPQHNARNRGAMDQVEQTAWVFSLVVPPGWLAVGAAEAADGNIWPALLGTLGLGLIGTASLWRAYRTTIRLYTGYYTRGRALAAVAAQPARASAGLLEWKLPGLSDQAAAVALGGLRSLLRAPEGKMLLLTPVIAVVVFGVISFTSGLEPPLFVRPLMALGGMAVTLLSMMHLMGNQFGFDRAGFRVFVLSGASRREVLLGKNLAFAPLALGLGLVLAAVIEVVYPLRPDHLAALAPQFVAMFLLFCLAANCLSILTPLPVAAGAMKPTNVRLVPALLQMAMLSVLPVAFAPLVAPLLLEFVLQQTGVMESWPVSLLLSVVVCAGVVLLYRWLVGWQGRWLHAREQAILEIVAARAE